MPSGDLLKQAIVGTIVCIAVVVLLAGCVARVDTSPEAAGPPSTPVSTPTTSVDPLMCPDRWSSDWAIPGQAAAGQLLPDGRVTAAVLCDYGAGPVADSEWVLVRQQDLTAEAQRRIDVAYGRANSPDGSRALVAASLPLLLMIGRLETGAEFRTLSWSGYATQPPWIGSSANARRDIVHTNGETTCFYDFDQSADQWRECPPDPASGN